MEKEESGKMATPQTILESAYPVDQAGLLSSLQYKSYQIQKLNCFSFRLAVVFAQSIEARC